MLRLLLVNTGSNLATMIVRLAIVFIMTPVLVHNLGRYDYGLWEMISGVMGYMGLFDLGTRPAVSRSSGIVQFSFRFLCLRCARNGVGADFLGVELWGGIGP